MDNKQSFKGYGKVNHGEEQAFHRKSRKRIVIIVVSIVILLAVIIGAVAGTVINKRNNKDSGEQEQLSSAQSIKAVCTQTQYPESCSSSLSAMDESNTTDPEELFKLSLQVALSSLSGLSSLPETLMKTTDNPNDKEALKVCGTVLNDAIDNLHDSISSMDVKSSEKVLSLKKIDDLRTWLSASLTNQQTCLDSLEEMDSTFLVQVKSQMQNSTEYTSNSLAIVTKIIRILASLDIPIHRKLLGEMKSGFPRWVVAGDRRLLQEGRPTPDVTVAKDGSGDVTTINDAMAKVPMKSKNRFVIYIKEGEYLENVVLNKSFWNVMIYGDGMDKSIISGSLNKVDGVGTFNTATLGVSGKGFIAMDMGFKNTAGGIKEQAVAMRSSSDFSVFYRCSFDAFQDTLYPHSNRQFYRECNVTGTVDFIFGNSAVVLQNCRIMPRQPLPNQFVTITAQGKTDPNENSGISIQKCEITPLNNLTAPTYLGRPWKDYSTTVIMQSSIGGFLNPLGWAEWDRGVEPPSSIFYAEYQNSGEGSAVDKRVSWSGYKPSLTSSQAAKFNVRSFIDGAMWLPQTDVDFDST
ncbi:pectinesterase 3 [Lactuca sativa]|uniref:Pectinesterase n=1 Tax=Lactuca sativa TaxID=4236 RepID=A0A9R1XH54_LACSA|nr:pectinesterase 3 [Lactuca sativa]KAJ0209839.1 hypothetical protein LSAT_V11C400193220 [Lactuca sativa]